MKNRTARSPVTADGPPRPPAVDTAAGAGLSIRVLTDFAAAAGLWDRLTAGDSTATFFSGHAWQSAWWHHYGQANQLLLVVVERTGRPVGMGSFMLTRTVGGGIVRFVGTGLSDYGDLLVDEQVTSRRSVVFAALDAVRQYCPHALFDLEQVPGRSGTATLVVEWAVSRGYRHRRYPQETCPFQRLPTDPQLLDAGLSQSTRRQERRNTKALGALGPVRLVASAASTAELDVLVATMAAIEREHPAAQQRMNSWQGDRGRFLTDVLAAAAASGQLWLSGLWVGETLVAYSVAFESGGVLYGYLQGYRQDYASYGPGTTLLLHLQRSAIRHGIHTFDFLRGGESYKLRWQTGVGLNERLLLAPAAAGPLVVVATVVHLVHVRWRHVLRAIPGLRRARHHLRRHRRPRPADQGASVGPGDQQATSAP